MLFDPDEIFEGLINFRKSIGATLKPVEYQVKFVYKPVLLYNPTREKTLPKFHIMNCTAVKKGYLPNWGRTSKTDGNFLMADGSVQRLQLCGFCRKEWRHPLPNPFDIKKFFAQSQYGWYPGVWDEINLPPDINEKIAGTGCFLLYRPVKYAPFHFMKCKKIRYDEKIGWIKTYRFTGNLSGFFAMFPEKKDKLYVPVQPQKLKVCPDCLAEWNNGKGWKNYNTADKKEKEKIRRNFNILEFFSTCKSLPERPQELAELYKLLEDNTVYFSANVDNNYPENWNDISKMFRTAQSYKCEECGADLSGRKNLLVTHHINGSHININPDNMRVLCSSCHAKQPYHGLKRKS